MTFSYFIPTMVSLMDGRFNASEAARIAQQWAGLNIIRLVASGLSFIAATNLFATWYKFGNNTSISKTSK